ncbi:putative metal-dependent hydrolase, composite domain superfamily, amidohydrolase 3 [Helianthus annuus]|nr:putative metal-dependent hydrolase, composite domain superfamily, amidohydrolase 3 [Helianthus annuus]
MNICSASLILLLSLLISLYIHYTHNTSGWRDPLWWFSSSSSSTGTVADLLVTNGTIYTSDSSLLFADSMAVRDGIILRIGNYSFVKEVCGHRTKELNLEGRIVVPGFIDSHVHLLVGGLQMVRVQVRGVKTKDDFIGKVKEAVKNMKDGTWLLGGGWNNDLWGGELPSASWIDDITPHHPVWLSRMDGHMGLANSLALRIAGVTSDMQDPVGGTISRNEDGEPTGLMIDSAMKVIVSCIPEVSVEERRQALDRASRYALSRGVTTVVDVGRYFPGASVEHTWEDFSDVYKWADLSGRMMIRVCLFFPMPTWSRLSDIVQKTGRRVSQWISIGGVKAFADGSLGSNSALFHEPYADEPWNLGLQVTDVESLYNMTLQSDKSGLQVAIHAIGDKANDLVLDMYKSVASTNGKRDRRFRIEHAQHLTVGTAAKFGEQGIVASVQPDHLLDDADSAVKKIGLERMQKGSYLFQSLLAGNALVAFGSDWPVADINPLNSIKTAITRIPPGWDKAWNSAECMKLTDALNAHTISAARACFLDDDIGSLSAGKIADFVILTTRTWDHMAQETTSVAATYVGGVQAYP